MSKFIDELKDFLYSEITERRDYTASKMCEVVLAKIEELGNQPRLCNCIAEYIEKTKIENKLKCTNCGKIWTLKKIVD